MKKICLLLSVVAICVIALIYGNKETNAEKTLWHAPMSPQMWQVTYMSCFPYGDTVNMGKVAWRCYDESTGESYWEEDGVDKDHCLFNFWKATFYAPNGWTAVMNGIEYSSGNHTSLIIVGGTQADASGQYPNWSIMYTIDLY